jgi:hypothetical protein
MFLKTLGYGLLLSSPKGDAVAGGAGVGRHLRMDNIRKNKITLEAVAQNPVENKLVAIKENKSAEYTCIPCMFCNGRSTNSLQVTIFDIPAIIYYCSSEKCKDTVGTRGFKFRFSERERGL